LAEPRPYLPPSGPLRTGDQPSAWVPATRVLFRHSVFEAAARAILSDIRRGVGLIVLTGEAGTGKTVLIHDLVERLPQDLTPVVLPDPRTDLTHPIGPAPLAAEPAGSASRAAECHEGRAHSLRDYLPDEHSAGRPLALFVDEAQHASEARLAQLLKFCDAGGAARPIGQLVLAGLPDLESVLRHSGLRELVPEGFSPHTLRPLEREETREVLTHWIATLRDEARAGFSSESLDAIALQSRGVMRLAQRLFSLALFTAELEHRAVITPDLIEEIAGRLWSFGAGGHLLPSGGDRAAATPTPAPPPRPPAQAPPWLVDLLDQRPPPQEKPMSRLDNLNRILKNLQSESPGVEASALISEDGLMIASVLSQDLDETRIAAMTATLLNLGTRAATELRRGEVHEVIVRGEHGYAVMISAGRGALLLVLANENTKLGLIFFDMREAIKTIRTVL